MAKAKTVYVCQNCGTEHFKWQGQCRECGEWNSLVEQVKKEGKSKSGKRAKAAKMVEMGEIEEEKMQRRSTGMSEVDRVLGGGLVAGEIILMAGEPGIGKSTLLTQLSVKADERKDGKKGGVKVVYVCGEESPGQVKMRVDRLGLGEEKIGSLKLLPETDVDSVLEALKKERPSLVVVDSIQSVTTSDLTGMAGSVGQIIECTNRLIDFGKRFDVPVMLVGHVTKKGEIAGPKILEHMVDCVLELTGDRYHELRLLRAVKNRFGATDEVGVFRMMEKGMKEIVNPSKVFLDERDEEAAGSAVAVVMEGTRPVLVEIQALVSKTELPVPRRVAQGIGTKRLQVLCGVLQKQAGLGLGSRDVFVKVTGGLSLKEPAVDLAVAMAVMSSYFGKSLEQDAVSVGEVGLLGEIRSVSWYKKRVKEAKKLGFSKIYSRDSYKRIKDLAKKIKK